MKTIWQLNSQFTKTIYPNVFHERSSLRLWPIFMSLLRLFCRGYALSNKQSPVLVNIPAAMDVLKEEINRTKCKIV